MELRSNDAAVKGARNMLSKEEYALAFSVRHGSKVKRCSSEGCTSYAKKGGVCVRHGAVKSKIIVSYLPLMGGI
eukprot:scaffold26652_cov151-Skeletonema_menzelii.AAC.11